MNGKTCILYSKRCKALVAVLLISVSVCLAQGNKPETGTNGTVCGIEVGNAVMKREGGLMAVNMELRFAGLEVGSNRATIFTPVIVNGTDSLALSPVGLYGRTRWYQQLRAGEKPLGGERENSIRWSECPTTMGYAQTVPYAEWMNGAQLCLVRSDYGCCRTLKDSQSALLAGWQQASAPVFHPVFRYVRPTAEAVKARELSGRAFVDFPVNKTEIYPDYRNNKAELAKIVATIDSVRSDKDVTVSALSIKGFASPEGSYAGNERLAKGRTEALKQYVRNLYHFSNDFISTDYEPEDWAGLREYVASSNMVNRDALLAIIDGNLAPDPKDARIRTMYPEQYAFLLREVYPGLRHSDYRIEYTIRTFTDINEIRQIMATTPQKLSLNEMFLLAQSLEAGSDEYNAVFDTAVRMYPNDATANLNAANAAMQRGDLVSAERYLSKTDNSTEAIYAKGIHAALKGDNAKAAQHFSIVADKMPEAAEALKTVKEIMEFSNN